MTHLFVKTTQVDGHVTTSVFDGVDYNKIVDGSHPFYAQIIQALFEDPQDRAKVEGLIDPQVSIEKALAEVSDRVTVDRKSLYIDGVAVHGAAAKFVVDRIYSGNNDWSRFVRFLLSLWENPNPLAQDAVWAWVERHGITITEDGRMVGFKGLTMGTHIDGREVPVSSHKGPNNFVNGRLYGETDVPYQVPHEVGTVISKRRADVDDNTGIACSTGLHVGGYDYARTFAENREEGYHYSTMVKKASTFALVAFAAEDVVSVPADNTVDWKIRVAKYEVLEFLQRVENVLKDMPDYAPQTMAPGADTSTPAPLLPEGQDITPERHEVVEDVEEDEAVAEQVEGSNGIRFDIVKHDGFFGDVVQESFDNQEDAEDALVTVWQVDDPEADFEVVPVYPEDEETADLDEVAGERVFDLEEVEPEEMAEPVEVVGMTAVNDGEILLHTPAAVKPTLIDWVEANPHSLLMIDLNDKGLGHKAIGRKYSEITSEASVRRFRANAGIKIDGVLKRVLG